MARRSHALLRRCFGFVSFLGCSALRAGERLDLATASKGSCATCSDLVHFHKHGGISWEIFPPQPTPGLDLAIMCIPNHHKRWGFQASDEVEQLLGAEDCGMEGVGEGLSKREKKSCAGLYARQNKRASFLGVPVAFIQQLAACGRCTICEAFAKVKDLWQKLKYAAKKVVSSLKKVKQYVFGFSYASAEVREGMEQRFEAYFPSALDLTEDEVGLEASMLQTAESKAESTSDDGHERMLRDALMKHLEGKSPEFIEQHLSMLERNLQEADAKEDEQLDGAKRELHSRAATERQSLEEQLPTLLSNKDCQKLVQSSLVSQVLTITLYVEVPHALNAALNLVMGNVFGALHSLLPKIYLQATPHTGGDHSATAVDKCLKALQQERKPLLDSCTHEHPFLSCTARTYQRLMEGALSQKWWPLRHDETGTTAGSINLGYKYDSLMKSLQCSAKGSCLETSLTELEAKELKVSELEKKENGLTRLEEMQCAFASSRVDREDGEQGKLPVFTDKIWAAALKAHGARLNWDTGYSTACPSVVPLVAAFCAEDLKCMDADKTGQGLLQPLEFDAVSSAAKAHIEKKLADLDLDSADKEDTSQRLSKFWDKMAKAEVWGLTPEEDVYQWNLLWRAANISSKAGVLSSWSTIQDALQSKTDVDWGQTMRYWETVLHTAFVKMRVRAIERKELEEEAADQVALATVMANLQSIFDTKFCSPGALGHLKNFDLRRLGANAEAALFAATFMTDNNAVVRMWKSWMVFNIKVKTAAERQELAVFERSVERAKCGCMCYDVCGEKEASAFVHCEAGLMRMKGKKEARESFDLDETFFASEVVVDRVFAVGAVYKSAILRVLKVSTPGSCGYRFEMNAAEVRRGKKGKRVHLRAFVSECDVPKFFALSSGADLRVTAWADSPEVNNVDWFLKVNQHANDFDDDLLDDHMHLNGVSKSYEPSESSESSSESSDSEETDVPVGGVTFSDEDFDDALSDGSSDSLSDFLPEG